MVHKEFQMKSVDRLTLFGQYWSPDDEVQGVMALVHGHGEHSSRYEPWAVRFVEKGMAVVTFDLRGHGRSEGKRGYSPSYVRMMEDIDILVQRAREYFPEKPVFLYGHSMGGNLVLGYAVRRCLALHGVVATSPWLKLRKEMPGVARLAVRLMSLVAPALTIHTRLDAHGISRDPVEVEKYVSDPLNHDLITPSLYLQIHDMGRKLMKGGEVNVPILVVHGTADPITDPAGSKAFVKNTIGDDVQLKLFEGLYHETHHEPERDEVFEYIYGWMADRLERKEMKQE